ncbi:hypothetical protein TDB9533_01568 [Thalassocella blandensis]|nr:hypothetical protein TDB9533_01568 [Thalassocella blandensis]
MKIDGTSAMRVKPRQNAAICTFMNILCRSMPNIHRVNSTFNAIWLVIKHVSAILN